jgi:hypothetical protein
LEVYAHGRVSSGGAVMRHYVVTIQLQDKSFYRYWYVVNTRVIANIPSLVAKQAKLAMDDLGNYVIPDGIALVISDITNNLRKKDIAEILDARM